MPTTEITTDDILKINSKDALIEFLDRKLGWPAPPDGRADELFYNYAADEMGLDSRTADQVRAQQLAPFDSSQPWGIFLIETSTPKLYASALRRVLRGLAPAARKQSGQTKAWQPENLLFIATHDYSQFTFAHFRGDKAVDANLKSFGWDARNRESGLRTLCEFNLPRLRWPDTTNPQTWLDAWDDAFDIEAVTNQFFKDFRNLFEDTKDALAKVIKKPAERHAFTQRLLNRLLFLCFLQKKRWLKSPNSSHPSPTYLFDLFDNALAQKGNYYADYLHPLFFQALNRPPASLTAGEREKLWRQLGIVPFLNGGLFDPTNDLDAADAVSLPNKLFEPIVGPNGLLRRYNFTVTESTPLNQEVAVDPEMLGKVFETVVLTSDEASDYQAPNLRKATGSYYTPRIVVTFIVRESLKNILVARVPGLSKDQLGELMDVDASAGLTNDARAHLQVLLTPQLAEAVRAAINPLTACDPAIGSGAFALGLLHEMVNLNILCETIERGRDPRLGDVNYAFDLKKRIIEHTIYGVDLQAKAAEICKLRLWLSLVVDYAMPDVDLDHCTPHQFEQAIAKIPALPNLGYKIKRGDALLDLVRGRPFQLKDVGRSVAMQDERDALEQIHREFFAAQAPDVKRALRRDALWRRTRLMRLQQEAQMKALTDAGTQIGMFERKESVAEIRKREDELNSLRETLAEVRAIESELVPLMRRKLTDADDALLMRLEATSEGEDITFTWELDFPEIFGVAREAPSTLDGRFAFVKQTEGQMEFPDTRETERGGFDLIVGNPPFVTARNVERREQYRARWNETCHMKFQLVAPFFQRSFGLLRPAGQLGFIVSNAFAKREFGKPLVEKFFPTVELQKIVDCSGLMFPGHGTPTCIVFGMNRKPAPEGTIRVVATLPGGGDLRTLPEKSPLWHSIQVRHEQPSYVDNRIIVASRLHMDMTKWPWNLDSTAEQTQSFMEAHTSKKLAELVDGEIGVCTMTNEDELFPMAADEARRLRIPKRLLKPFQEGDGIRDWSMDSDIHVLVPYDKKCNVLPEDQLGRALDYLFPFRNHLSLRRSFGNQTFKELRRPWYSFERMNANKYSNTRFIAFGEIATHNHFVFSQQDRIYKQTCQTIKLPTASPEAHLVLSGLLNSSSSSFWLKQVCFNKGAGDSEERDRFVYAGGKVELLPIADKTLSVNHLSFALTKMARACMSHGEVVVALAAKRLFELSEEAYSTWNTALSGWVVPWNPALNAWNTPEHLLAARDAYAAERDRLRGEMIALQEEMDWLCYLAYGLIEDASLTYDFGLSQDANANVEALRLGERPFELLRDGRAIPAYFSTQRRTLWQRRMDEIARNEHVRRIEQPIYKRRWYRKLGDADEFRKAFDWWLLEKAEWWLEHKSKGGPVMLDVWAKALWQDERIRAASATIVLGIDGADDLTAFAKLLRRTVIESTVPDWIPPTMPWDQVEKKFKTTVPARTKKIRGKLNVPRERFRSTDDGAFVWAGK